MATRSSAVAMRVCVIVVCGALRSPALAETVPFESPLQRTFVFQEVHKYTERRYQPAVRLDPHSESHGAFENPEDALSAQLSAMAAGDVDAWLTTWDQESRDEIWGAIQQGTLTRERLREEWHDRFDDAVVSLRVWYDFASFVVLEYDVVQAGAGRRSDLAIFTHDIDAGWRGTNSLRGHPIVESLRTGISETRRRVR
jgi:hypothetical protein